MARNVLVTGSSHGIGAATAIAFAKQGCNVGIVYCKTKEGAEQTECFHGFQLLSKEEARAILLSGRDKYQNFYSVYTWIALVYFISDIWED